MKIKFFRKQREEKMKAQTKRGTKILMGVISLFLFSLFFYSFSLVSAASFGYNSDSAATSTTFIVNTTASNSSEYWRNLGTPDDIVTMANFYSKTNINTLLTNINSSLSSVNSTLNIWAYNQTSPYIQFFYNQSSPYTFGSYNSSTPDQLYSDNNFLRNDGDTGTGNYIFNQNVTIDTNTFFVDSNLNRVGLGTNTPSVILDVVGGFKFDRFSKDSNANSNYISLDRASNATEDNVFLWKTAGTTQWILGQGISYAGGEKFGLKHSPSGLWAFVADTAGNVGIGTTAPGAKLHVNGNIYTNSFTTGDGAGIFLRDTVPTTAQPSMTVSTAFGANADGLRLNGFSGVGMYVNDNQVLYVDSSLRTIMNGNVGIGTATPVVPLQVVGAVQGSGLIRSTGGTSTGATGPGLEIQYPTGSDYGALTSYDRTAATYKPVRVDGSTVSLSISGTQKVHVDASGNVGIGTTSPTYPLEVINNVSGISIFASGNISADDYITRTDVWDKSRFGNALSYIKNSSQIRKNGVINHSAIFPDVVKHSYNKQIGTNYSNSTSLKQHSNSSIQIINITTNATKTTYVYWNETIITPVQTPIYEVEQLEGVSISSWLGKHEEALYELKKENDGMKNALCSLGVAKYC